MDGFICIRKFKDSDIDYVMQIWYNSNIDTYTFIDKEYFERIKNMVRDKFLNSNIYMYMMKIIILLKHLF